MTIQQLEEHYLAGTLPSCTDEDLYQGLVGLEQICRAFATLVQQRSLPFDVAAHHQSYFFRMSRGIMAHLNTRYFCND